MSFQDRPYWRCRSYSFRTLLLRYVCDRSQTPLCLDGWRGWCSNVMFEFFSVFTFLAIDAQRKLLQEGVTGNDAAYCDFLYFLTNEIHRQLGPMLVVFLDVLHCRGRSKFNCNSEFIGGPPRTRPLPPESPAAAPV